MISKDTVVVVNEQNVLAADVEKDVVLLHLKKGIYYTLDDTGADIWRMLAVPIKAATIIDRIMQQYDAPAAQVERDVLALLADMEQEGLIAASGKEEIGERESGAAARHGTAAPQATAFARDPAHQSVLARARRGKEPVISRHDVLSRLGRVVRGRKL